MDDNTMRLLNGLANSRFANEGVYGEHQWVFFLVVGIFILGLVLVGLAALLNAGRLSAVMMILGILVIVFGCVLWAGITQWRLNHPGPDTVVPSPEWNDPGSQEAAILNAVIIVGIIVLGGGAFGTVLARG